MLNNHYPDHLSLVTLQKVQACRDGREVKVIGIHFHFYQDSLLVVQLNTPGVTEVQNTIRYRIGIDLELTHLH